MNGDGVIAKGYFCGLVVRDGDCGDCFEVHGERIEIGVLQGWCWGTKTG